MLSAPIPLRVCASRAVHFACLGLACSPAACASTAGSSSYQAQSADYARSEPLETSRAVAASLKAPVLERKAYVCAVLRANRSVESARQAWRAALARVRQAGAFEDPMLDVGVAPLSIASSKAPIGWEVGISQKLPWFGKRSLDAAVAASEAEAMKSDYESTRRDLVLTAQSLYDQYFVAERALEINAEHVGLMKTMRDGATAQFASGRGSAQDSLQAEAELTHMEHDAVVLASQRAVTVAQMNELLHRGPEMPLPPPPKDLPLPPPMRDSSARLQAQAVETRPDIVAVRRRARAEQVRADRADREYYPDVTLSTSYNSMWDMPEHRWMVGIGFSLPIQTGARAAARDEALAMRTELESDAERMSDSARTQVFASLKQLEESEHLLKLYETRLLPVARDQIDAARAGFITAQNSFVAVVEAERNLRKVELEYQMARAEYASRRAELDHALGRISLVDCKEDK